VVSLQSPVIFTWYQSPIISRPLALLSDAGRRRLPVLCRAKLRLPAEGRGLMPDN
jgi:hypothetical protein